MPPPFFLWACELCSSKKERVILKERCECELARRATEGSAILNLQSNRANVDQILRCAQDDPRLFLLACEVSSSKCELAKRATEG
jgi:hypothetical protein